MKPSVFERIWNQLPEDIRPCFELEVKADPYLLRVEATFLNAFTGSSPPPKTAAEWHGGEPVLSITLRNCRLPDEAISFLCLRAASLLQHRRQLEDAFDKLTMFP